MNGSPERGNVALDVPVRISRRDAPIIPTERWREVSGALVKRYDFMREQDRTRFVSGLMEYEADVGHHALIAIRANVVELRVNTENVDRPTELDKEYAAFADILHRDVVYASTWEEA